jgi:hypothetical protein
MTEPKPKNKVRTVRFGPDELPLAVFNYRVDPPLAARFDKLLKRIKKETGVKPTKRDIFQEVLSLGIKRKDSELTKKFQGNDEKDG